MSYNAYVGFRNSGQLKIWYNKLPSYDDNTAWMVVKYFEDYQKDDLKRVFLEGIRFGNLTEKMIWFVLRMYSATIFLGRIKIR